MFIVTGGAGFIGSNLVHALECSYPTTQIVVCDFLGSDEKWQNLAKRSHISTLIYPEDLSDFLHTHSQEIKAIFHLGAISSTTERDADLIVRSNIHLSLDLWHWCTQYKIPFIYASSAATYGDGQRGFIDTQELEELKHLRPLNAYGWSKHFFDLKAVQMSLRGIHPPQWVGLKFFNVYGPNEYHKEGQKSVISTFYHHIQKQGGIHLFKSTDSAYPDGGQIRDFIWVQDCIRVMIWMYEHPLISGLFNVGTGMRQTFNDLAHGVFKSLSLSPQIEYIEMPESLRDKYQNFTQANLTKLRSVGYSNPFISLEEGINLYIQNFLTQGDPYL